MSVAELEQQLEKSLELVTLPQPTGVLSKKLSAIAHTLSPEAQQFLAMVEQEIEVLVQKYAGVQIIVEGLPHPIIITRGTIEHVIGAEIQASLRRSGQLQLKGLHHKVLRWEENGILQFSDKKLHSFGVMESKVQHNGIMIKKFNSSFPANWSYDTLFDKLIEATKNIIRSPELQKNGAKIFRGITSEGIQFEIIINNAGQIITFYPFI